MSNHEHSASERIRDAGLRATKTRLVLFEFLQNSNYPVSILEIAKKLRSKIDQVTVYRVIDAFKAAGLVREVDLRQGRPLYEIIHGEHHHVVCTKCNKVEDFDCCEYSGIAKNAIKQVKGFAQINSHSLELFGLCTTCVKNN